MEKNLIPRIHGFEILMASYTIAHLKLALTLKNTGYDRPLEQRLNVFLTNSLEEATPRSSTLFSKWLSDEADAASEVKTKTPVMICLGNPPYSVSSLNSGKWITDLVAEYKKNLAERNIQPLSDDYIKFIRLGHYYVAKKGEGILAIITNNSFIDGIIHRQMRKSLLEEFDQIFILDLHGNSRKKELAPDGTEDKNVFDIMQGVSINIFVKTGKKEKGALAKVFHKDLYGTRETKYDWLNAASFSTIEWTPVEYSEPYYFFVPKDFSDQAEYDKGFKLDELFVNNVSGIKTSNDTVNIWDTRAEVETMVYDLLNLPQEEFRTKYNAGKDTRDWSVGRAVQDVSEAKENGSFRIEPVQYRPFDTKFIVYTGKTNGIVARPRFRSLAPMLHPLNSAICTIRINRDYRFTVVAVNKLADKTLLSSKDDINLFPLYNNTGEAGRNVFETGELIPNFDPEVFKSIESSLGEEVQPQDLFDYIYAVLHCPKYRETYKEFLKIDFPRIPYPKDAEQFHRLAEKGAELRKLHLMDGASSWPMTVTFPVAGDNMIDKLSYTDGKVFINAEQYFSGVSELAWNFFIGGYQPAQKWLKDRKGRTLEYEDILHYGRIIYALQETDRIMKEIDEIGVI